MKPFDYQARKHTINKIDILKRQESKSDNDFKNEYLDINSINLDLNETIYRIFNYDFFIQDLIAKKLTLINPSKWDDPFENFLFSSTGVLDDGREVSFENISNSYFALCWSLRAVSYTHLDVYKRQLDKNVIENFIAQQKEFCNLLEQAKNVDLNKEKTKISITNLIKLKLGDTFLFLNNHTFRHLKQIENIEKNACR